MPTMGQRATLAAAARAAAETIGLDELGAATLPALKAALRAHLSILNETHETGHVLYTGDVPDCDPTAYWERFAPMDPWQAAVRETRSPIVILGRTVAASALEPSQAFEEYYRPRRIRHGMAVRLVGPRYFGPASSQLVLFREADQPDFSDEDAAALARIVPQLQAAVVRARRAALERTGLAVLDAVLDRALVVITPRGEIAWGSRRAAALLGPRCHLPPAVVAAARGLAQGAGAGPLWTGAGWITLTAATGAGGERVVLGELSEAPLEALSRAERTVLDGLRRGLGNAAIGRQLRVSVATVKTHVHRILGKLGVRSRMEAVVRAGGWRVEAPRPRARAGGEDREPAAPEARARARRSS